MRWDALILLVSDSRVQFLLWFIVVAFILAGVLALIEFRLKRKKEKRAIQNVNELAVEKIRRFLKSDKTPREKLDFIDRTAKAYFKETYGTSLNSTYSVLTEEFEKMRRNNEIAFCKTMFATYYLNKELSKDRVIVLGNLLISIEKSKESVDKISQVPSFMERVNNLFHRARQIISRKFRKREKQKHTKKLKQHRIAKRNHELKIAKEKARIARRQRISIVKAQRIKNLKRVTKKSAFNFIGNMAMKLKKKFKLMYFKLKKNERDIILMDSRVIASVKKYAKKNNCKGKWICINHKKIKDKDKKSRKKN